MRSRMTRLSVSSCVSPGPREPIPPCVRERCVHKPRQAGQLVLELGQFDLQAALVGTRVLSKDVEDQPGAIEHLHAEQAFQATLLVGADLIIRHEHGEAGLGLGLDELLGLAFADVPVRIDVAAVLPLRADHFRAGGDGQVAQLGQRLFSTPTGVLPGVDGDEEGTLDRRRHVDRRWPAAAVAGAIARAHAVQHTRRFEATL